MRRFLSWIIILIGLVLISIPFISNLMIRNTVNKNLEMVEDISYDEIEENESREAVFDYSRIQDIDISNIIINANIIDNKSIIGYMLIDDVGISLPILKGVTDRNLLSGATTMMQGQEMGKGNYPLAGHYNKGKSLFGPLLDIKEGSIVKITNKRTVYEYRIYDTKIVPDTAMYMIDLDRDDDRDKPIISLMTCYYTSKNEKRFFALGELVNEYPYASITVQSE